jgi:drug/metabolite transporter (DMT)-like permease
MRQVGIIQALLSGFCFGFLGIFGKYAFSGGLQPGEFLAFRFLLAAFFLFLWLLRTPEKLRVSRRQLFSCIALGVGGYAVFSSCFFFALQGLSASLTVLLLYTYPVVVSLGAWMLFGERLQGLELLALPVVIVGLVSLVWGEMEVRSVLSLGLGLASALFYSVYILASSRLLKGVDPFAATLYILLSAGATLGAWHLRASSFGLHWQVWAVLLGAALVSSLLAMGLFLAALQKLTNGEVSLLSTAEPVTGVILAALVLGERPLPLQWLGGALVVLGMLLVAQAKRKTS